MEDFALCQLYPKNLLNLQISNFDFLIMYTHAATPIVKVAVCPPHVSYLRF